MNQIIRVLVVDDSAFVRKVLAQMLSRSPFIEVVGTARDGEEALEMTERLAPDVVTLDLVMSPMNGVEYLRRQMQKRALPVVVCSITHETGAMALDALEAGAVEFVQKPTALATDKLLDIGDEIVAKVKTASAVRMANVLAVPAAAKKRPVRAPAVTGGRLTDLVVIGVSTGGPQALRQLIPALPADFPAPIAVVLHMPVGYTEMFARRLDDISHLRVSEAGEAEEMVPGRVFIAPGGRHLSVRRTGEGVLCTHLDVRPIEMQHRPAVDVLFRSAAEACGERVLGLVMTGMGNDGLLGAAEIKGAGGRIITEAESSCVVYGMPRVVDEGGLSDASAPVDELGSTLEAMVQWPRSSS